MCDLGFVELVVLVRRGLVQVVLASIARWLISGDFEKLGVSQGCAHLRWSRGASHTVLRALVHRSIER